MTNFPHFPPFVSVGDANASPAQIPSECKTIKAWHDAHLNEEIRLLKAKVEEWKSVYYNSLWWCNHFATQATELRAQLAAANARINELSVKPIPATTYRDILYGLNQPADWSMLRSTDGR